MSLNSSNSNTVWMRAASSALVGAVTLAAAGAFAQSAVSLTPLKGQGAEQIQKDQAECASTAQQTVGAAPEAKKGGALKGAAVGAGAGAATAHHRGGEAYDRAPDAARDAYREDQARQGARAGAAVGALAQRRDNQKAEASHGQALDQAYRSCLVGRGYQVK